MPIWLQIPIALIIGALGTWLWATPHAEVTLALKRVWRWIFRGGNQSTQL